MGVTGGRLLLGIRGEKETRRKPQPEAEVSWTRMVLGHGKCGFIIMDQPRKCLLSKADPDGFRDST
jgi:hypothetical protein